MITPQLMKEIYGKLIEMLKIQLETKYFPKGMISLTGLQFFEIL